MPEAWVEVVVVLYGAMRAGNTWIAWDYNPTLWVLSGNCVDCRPGYVYVSICPWVSHHGMLTSHRNNRGYNVTLA